MLVLLRSFGSRLGLYVTPPAPGLRQFRDNVGFACDLFLEILVTANDLSTLIGRAERVLAQLEAWLPPAPPEIDWTAHAFRWRKRGARGWLDAVQHVSSIAMQDLQHIDRKKSVIDRDRKSAAGGKRVSE